MSTTLTEALIPLPYRSSRTEYCMRLHLTPQSKLHLGLSLTWLCKHSLFAMPEGVQEVEVVVLRELHEEDLTGMLSTSMDSTATPKQESTSS